MKSKIKRTPIPLPFGLASVLFDQFMHIISGYVHSVWYKKKASDIEEFLGTAVMVRAGQRLFAITAGHCVQDVASKENHEIIKIYFHFGKDQHNKVRRFLRVIPHKSLDVAIVELENHSDIFACDIEQLYSGLPKPGKNENGPMWIVGFPGDESFASADDNKLSITQASFGTDLISCNDNVLQMYYHKDGFKITNRNYDNAILSPLPKTPEGFSGGGIWRMTKIKGRSLFVPSRHIQLVGIEYGWYVDNRLLQAVPSPAVLQLLRDNYPDL